MTHLESQPLNASDLEFLDQAADFFENPGLVAKGLAWAGKPVENMHDRLPARVQTTIASISERAIQKALMAAVKTIPDQIGKPENVTRGDREQASLLSSRVHRGLTTFTGAIGGLIGLPALAIELPITTVLILRAISEQAKLFGHDLNDLEIRLECLMVFTMGVPSSEKMILAEGVDAPRAGERKSITNYFMTRASFLGIMRRAASTAGAFTAKEILTSVEKGTAPIVARLVSSVAEKFQVRVSQKFLAESVPLVGAIGGGALNYAFTDFFVTAARFHFGIRRLEKLHGEGVVQDYLRKKPSA